MYIYIYIYTYRPAICVSTHIHTNAYGLATMSRLLKITGLSCKRVLLKRDYILQKRPII